MPCYSLVAEEKGNKNFCGALKLNKTKGVVLERKFLTAPFPFARLLISAELICRTESVPAELTKHIAAVSAYNIDYILSRKKTSERLLTHSPGQDIKSLPKGESE